MYFIWKSKHMFYMEMGFLKLKYYLLNINLQIKNAAGTEQKT